MVKSGFLLSATADTLTVSLFICAVRLQFMVAYKAFLFMLCRLVGTCLNVGLFLYVWVCMCIF